ncbi:MAG: GntR family transcriptional regulator [Dehalococcoidales bacterium]|nr:GntR family transcriptional regulator [Dehalococcoidales bacterium]
MITLNYRDSAPIYAQIKENLRHQIISGILTPGEKLPSVRELATQLSINPNTIQRAYNELELEGFIVSVLGKGNYVSSDFTHDPKKIEKLKDTLKKTADELRFMGVTDAEIQKIIMTGESHNDRS